MNGKKILFYSAAGLFIAAGGYLLYVKVIKPIIAKQKAEKDAANLPAETPATTGSTGGTTGGTTGGGSAEKSNSKDTQKINAIGKGMNAYRWWNKNTNSWEYYTTGLKTALLKVYGSTSHYAVQPDIRILQPVDWNDRTTGGTMKTTQRAVEELQKYLNEKGANIGVDGAYGLQTANATAKYIGWDLKPFSDTTSYSISQYLKNGNPQWAAYKNVSMHPNQKTWFIKDGTLIKRAV